MMQKKIFSLFKLFLLSGAIVAPLLFSACHKDSPTPVYLHIAPFSLTSNLAAQGSNSNKIEDVWVYVNKQPLGAYQLPCTIPVIADNGKTEVILFPGILKGGITSMHVKYPFYKSFTDIINFVQGKTFSIAPITKYVDSLKFKLKEDFENGNSFIKLLGDTSIFKECAANIGIEGCYGHITLDATHDTVEVISSSSFVLPENTTPVFIEMNYKNDYPFTIGLQANTSSTVTKYWQETFVAKSNWNKVYIDITDAVSQLQGTTYQIIIKAGNTYGEITSPENLYFDNIKLISY